MCITIWSSYSKHRPFFCFLCVVVSDFVVVLFWSFPESSVNSYLFIVCLSFKHHVSFYCHLAVVERKCCQGQPLGKQYITTRSTHLNVAYVTMGIEQVRRTVCQEVIWKLSDWLSLRHIKTVGKKRSRDELRLSYGNKAAILRVHAEFNLTLK